MNFRGFKTGGQTYRRSPRRPECVLTYDGPQSICLFAAGCFGRVELTALDDTLGEVPILDAEGQPVDGFDEYLVWLLSDDERDLISMFGGVDMAALHTRSKRALEKGAAAHDAARTRAAGKAEERDG
jgi:hypothetical protein